MDVAGRESFWNSIGHGLRPWCLSQFQLSFTATSRWVPAPSGNVRSEPQPRAKVQGQATTPSLFPDLICVILLAIYFLL